MAGKNATISSPNIVVIPGGPGNSGVDLLLGFPSLLGEMFGEQYNFVSFDPRGVNNSGLYLDCFSEDTNTRSAFNRLHRTGQTNISSTSFEEQYYSSSIYGEWCNDAVEKNYSHSYYVTTPAVARDLLTFTEAEARLTGQSPSHAKLWAYGVSYGTVIGSTFASMFPDRVGRMVLDGVLNAEQYYENYWTDNVDQMDEAMETFSNFCHSAGVERCSFWGPTPANITARIDAIISQLLTSPIPLSGVEDSSLPTMVTYSDLKTLFLNTIYQPIALFPTMADILQDVERGNPSALAGLYEESAPVTDARLAITCMDSFARNNLTTIDEFRAWSEYTNSKSKYIGDVYPTFLEGEVSARHPPTSFPILFASNTIDPITPLESARKMSSRFAGSVILKQEAVGHTVIYQGGSDCYFEHVQAYLQGTIPSPNTTCPLQYTPFIDSSLL
ncbi:alpha/beta-hydrolase [Penicillium angulare]|uniref:alpha/beta-hydrolase n=1 Tax=Penicillium angulare TaxID=116970 RepID=UPI00253F8E01|nr:alpha/beta-hydrolase [Penicillium angulare]KAJ5261089.1 alpha/beta-hydrolase [Penicillium angulare]